MKFKMWKRERTGRRNKKEVFDEIEAAAEKKHRAKRAKRNKIAKESRKKNRK